MQLRWREEDDTHPVRPDFPVTRHLTFTEVHALELGAYIGLLVYFGLEVNLGQEIVVLLIGIVRFTMSDGRAKAGASKVTHRLGFHDVRQEPHYFGGGVVIAFALTVVAFEAWAVLGQAGVV